MNNIYFVGECVFVGVCGYAAFQHGLFAIRRPVDRMHLLFALLCLVAALYFLDQLAVQWPGAVAMGVVPLHRKAFFSVTFFVVLAWFVAAYTRVESNWLLAGLSVLLVARLWFQALTPFGIGAVFTFSFYACVRQYARGARRQALALGLAVGLLLAFMLLKYTVNDNVVEDYDISAYGFLSLVAIMSYNLMLELRQNERQLHSVLDNVPAAIYIKDSEERYLWINRCFENLFHANRVGVRGKTDSVLFPELVEQLSDRGGLQSRQSRRSQVPEIALNRNGEIRTFSSHLVSLAQADGNPEGLCGVLTDITELRQAEVETQCLRQQIRHAGRVLSIGALTNSMAHELNQPLAAILSNAQAGIRFLGEPHPDLAEIGAILQDIARDDKRASKVIGALRDLMQRNEPERQQMDLAESTDEAIQLLRTELLSTEIDVATHYDEGCHVMADKILIQQVQINLIVNAIEATQGQPALRRCLEIAVLHEDDEVVKFMIRDHGIGLDNDRPMSPFDLFAGTKPGGIGLAISRSIIESHHGSIWAERNVDAGLTFFFTLPGITRCSTDRAELHA